jgi:ABC-type multidrug transport system ATPase subunit
VGEILVNGKKLGYEEFRSISGYVCISAAIQTLLKLHSQNSYVDQEDTLMDTLTVYETILYSALLRLPKGMTLERKKLRVQETMRELDIVHIADRRIGNPGIFIYFINFDIMLCIPILL